MAIRGGGNARRDELHEQYWYFGVSTVTFCAHLQAKEAGVHRVHRPFVFLPPASKAERTRP
jgi:hypothetical protein|uniref:Uncharacterized protein n=1 Tax=Siphoviridae sp. ctkL423 TaxID=2823596 RepID=A0A8S5LDQ9_9CAUD|nr:MAG TPA: hypothetical protein [Siphoviridae sp. ctkL423]